MAVHKPSDRIIVEDCALIHQWRDVFRYTVGGQVLVFDDSKSEYLAMIEEIGERKATLVLLEKRSVEKKNTRKEKGVWLMAAMLKGDNFDWIVEKTTEVGVSHITPCITERTVKTGANIERLRKIATEAAEQSGRRDVPTVGDICQLERAIADFKATTNGIVLVCNEGGKTMNQLEKEIVKQKKKVNTNNIAVLIGPEGGWSPKEVQYFKDTKCTFITLGKNVLRAETAAVVAVHSLMQR